MAEHIPDFNHLPQLSDATFGMERGNSATVVTDKHSAATELSCGRWLQGYQTYLNVRLGYSDADPHEISADFLTPNGWEQALVDRELLNDALANGSAGQGEVRINRVVDEEGDDTFFHLETPVEKLVFQFDSKTLLEFMKASKKVVSMGRAQKRMKVAVDQAIAEIFAADQEQQFPGDEA